MADETAEVRRLLIAGGIPQADLDKYEGQIWDTEALKRDFTVRGFAAPYVVVVRKSDSQVGSLEFTDNPRVYFDFHPHTEGCE